MRPATLARSRGIGQEEQRRGEVPQGGLGCEGALDGGEVREQLTPIGPFG